MPARTTLLLFFCLAIMACGGSSLSGDASHPADASPGSDAAVALDASSATDGGHPSADDASRPSSDAASGPPLCGSGARWTDLTSAQITALGGEGAQSYPGGVSGVVVNRLTGDLYANIVGFGVWRSSDRGDSWTRVDQGTLDDGGGRCETGWSLQIDQDDPRRIAAFTLDGTAGYTTDGTTWTRWAFSGWGRNWDFGAIDWSTPSALTVFGVLHETDPRNQYLFSMDGGGHWTAQDATRVAPTVGIVDAHTFLASRTTGIERSTDGGMSWTRVSDVTPLGHVVTRFGGRLYVTTAEGVIVSRDDGRSWSPLGGGIDGALMFLGPYFGADDRTFVVGTHPTDSAFGGGTSSIYKTTDGGTTWTKIADVPDLGHMFPIGFAWYGSLAWDPISDTYYVSAMSNPALRLDCAP